MKVFVDTAAVMEKPLAAAAGLGWQGKHTNLVSREYGSWLFLGAIFTTLELPPDDAGDRSLRQVPRLPRRLPDRGVSGALPARCAALHFLPDHRAQGPDPARAAAADRQPHLRLRRLPRGLPVEQVRAGRPRGEARGARGAARARARRTGAARRCGIPRDVRQDAGQAHRPRPLRAQCADRDRQFRRRRAGARRPSGCSTTPRRWCAAPRCGRLAACCRETNWASSRSARPKAMKCAEEWRAALGSMAGVPPSLSTGPA